MGWRSAREATRLRYLGDRFLARWMSWDWSTWITEDKGLNHLTLMIGSWRYPQLPRTRRESGHLAPAPLLPAQWNTFPTNEHSWFPSLIINIWAKWKPKFSCTSALCFECVGLPIAWGSGDAVQQHKQHEKKHRHPEVIHAVSVITCKHNRSYMSLLCFRENQRDVW